MPAIRNILIYFIILFFFYSCEKEKVNSSSEAALRFSSSTIAFDTLFTSVGSATKNLRVTNQTNNNLVISSVRLAGGKQSGFKLNINGEVVNEATNIKIPAGDSIYIFVDAMLGKTGKDIPLVSEDSILFYVNNIEQKVKLTAGQKDFNLIKSAMIKTTHWTK